MKNEEGLRSSILHPPYSILRVGLRRMTLMLMLAVVLSALEVERRGPLRRPSPVVVVLTDPPGPRPRARAYRAHARRSVRGGN
jgi:hypothetical protein